MKIVQINTFPYKATGNIMMNIHKLLVNAGHDSYVVWGRGRKPQNRCEIAIKDAIGVKFHGIFTRITDRTGFVSQSATKKLIKSLNKIQPDILHLHNIHGYYLNIEMLFEYIKSRGHNVVWTMHDCWPITGHCAYFDMVGCTKWKTGCHHCEQKYTYPQSNFMDSSEWNWQKKRDLFTYPGITIVTPSKWLKDIFDQSFMNKHPIQVIHNGINLDIFAPTYNIEMRKKYCPSDKSLVLSVASEWTERKGLTDIIALSKRTNEFQFVIVGLTKKQLKGLPKNVLGLERTNNTQELVYLYSIADVFFNPTYEDNFPTTNIEALACGTPVVTYNTGGSPESLQIASDKAKCIVGRIVNKRSPAKVNFDEVLAAITEMANAVKADELSNYTVCQIRKACRTGATIFSTANSLKSYLELYKEILHQH